MAARQLKIEVALRVGGTLPKQSRRLVPPAGTPLRAQTGLRLAAPLG
jgi:hypothetical protein